MAACLWRKVEVGLGMQLTWHDTIGGGSFAGEWNGTMRTIRRDGESFLCDWREDGKEPELWYLDPVSNLAAAKAVVESWETPQGWEDDDS